MERLAKGQGSPSIFCLSQWIACSVRSSSLPKKKKQGGMRESNHRRHLQAYVYLKSTKDIWQGTQATSTEFDEKKPLIVTL